MSNLSKKKRERMVEFLNELRAKHDNEDTLRLINEIEQSLTEKKYGLVWEKHSETVYEMLENNFPIFQEITTKKIESKDNSPEFSFLLEGDNLHSLTLLQKTHFEKIDVIYIDPPYNMGKEDFTYNDRFVGEDDAFKHSKWLSFMDERLKLAYSLLSDKGFIAISIDENENAQLKLLCDEIFGEHNLLTVQHVQVRYENKSLNERNDWQPVMEYVFIYAKDSKKFKANRPQQPYDIKGFTQEITELSKGHEVEISGKKVVIFKKGEWKRKTKDPNIKLLKATWVTGSIYTDTGHGTTYQNIVEPRYNIDGYGSLYKIIGLGEDGLGYRYMRNPNNEKYTKGEMFSGVPVIRLEEMESETGSIKHMPISNLFNYSAEFGNIRQEGGIAFNKGKKPVKMIKEIINYHKRKDITVLDFFAGSGTTGHATISLNNDDGGNRKYIICTNNENMIAETITYQRINNIQKELPHNMKYYKTEFVPKINFDQEESLREKLLRYVKPLIELEYCVEIDGFNNVLVFEEENIINAINISNKKANLFINSDLFLTNHEISLATEKMINIIEIPEYYFRNELMEVGEL